MNASTRTQPFDLAQSLTLEQILFTEIVILEYTMLNAHTRKWTFTMAFFVVLLDVFATQHRSAGTNTSEQYEFIIELYFYAEHKSTIP